MAAPKHNRFALGNNGGRPQKYETPEALFSKIIEYFEWCENDNQSKVSITGLTLYLGFESRKSLQDYEERGHEFSTLIKRARLAVESYYEEKLTGMAYGGAIFALKNLASEYWKDKTEQDVNQKITNVNAKFSGDSDNPV